MLTRKIRHVICGVRGGGCECKFGGLHPRLLARWSGSFWRYTVRASGEYYSNFEPVWSGSRKNVRRRLAVVATMSDGLRVQSGFFARSSSCTCYWFAVGFVDWSSNEAAGVGPAELSNSGNGEYEVRDLRACSMAAM